MKHSMLKTSLLGLLLLPLSLYHVQDFTAWYYPIVSDHDRKAREVIQDNEHQSSSLGEDAVIPCHPLLLNGKAFDDENFDIHSKGTLTMVEARPEASEARPIPFRVSRKRNGMLLEEHAGATLEGEYGLDVSLLLAHSYSGDQLIIYPIKKEYCKAKRVLRITSDNC